MPVITPEQSRTARRELAISQADVATAVSINRAYVSDFESGNLNRLTNSQLKKLRAFYESAIEEANANGDEIDLSFGEENIAPETKERIESNAASRVVIPVDPEVSDETVRTINRVKAENRKKLADLLTTKAERDDALFGDGELTEGTLKLLREAFSRLATNELLTMSVCGWPEVGIAAGKVPITDDTVLSLIVGDARDAFIQAGLISEDVTESEVEE